MCSGLKLKHFDFKINFNTHMLINFDINFKIREDCIFDKVISKNFFRLS